MHPSITVERVLELTEEGMFGMRNPGICKRCGEDADGVEPDCSNIRCDACGSDAVTAAEQLMFEIVA